MLNWSKVAKQIEGLAASQAGAINEWRQKMTQAQADLELAENDLAALTDKAVRSQTSWLVAEPVESLSKVNDPPARPPELAVVATDGSQIAPDHHEVALCYLLNIGRVMLIYGTGEPALLESLPFLGHQEEDIYYEFNGRKTLVQGDLLAIRRTLYEWEQLVELSNRASLRRLPVVALVDGTLIQWVLEGKSDQVKKDFLNRYLKLSDQVKELGVPTAGYLSGSRATDVVNLLRLYRCPLVVADCDHCVYRRSPEPAPCAELDGLTDTVLFQQRLAPGQRTGLFYSQSKVLEHYRDHKVGFFYLNVGSEIARVELPAWAAKDEAKISLVHTVILDQTNKGQGYPVALAEAHEQAVVKGADREAFFRLVTEALVRRGVKAEVSSKSCRKRSGLV